MIIEIKNFLDRDQIDFIRNRMVESEDYGMGRCGNRQGQTILITNNDKLKDVDEALFEIFGKVYREILEPMSDFQNPLDDSGYEFHRYNKGEMCEPHVDSFFSFGSNNTSSIRVLTAVIHLTDDKSVLVFPNQKKRIRTEAGKLVLFSPDIFHGHYSTKASECREIIMTWFTLPNFYAARRD